MALSMTMKIYHKLPPFIQNWAASYRGAQLQQMRYGDVFRSELPGYVEREKWSFDEWEMWQSKRLQFILRRAVERVPYYRSLYRMGRFPIEEVTDTSKLHYLPVLEKDELRERPLDFLADDCRPSKMIHEWTSGTTGKPIDLYWSQFMSQSWYACMERRARNRFGVSIHDRWAALSGKEVVPYSRSKPPFWVWNRFQNQLYMSVFHLKSEFMDHYLDEIKRRKIVYLLGYATALSDLAAHALERKRDDIHLKAVISNAESLYPYRRQNIEQAFHCRAVNTYGAAELTFTAFDCSEGRLHLSPEIGIFEVVDDHAQPLPAETSGEVLGTSLINPDHILIRYRQGDRASLAKPFTRCGCGLEMPIVENVDGRVDDVLWTPDGRSVARFDKVFKIGLHVKEGQIIQWNQKDVELKVVPSPGFNDSDRVELKRGMEERIGEDMNVAINLVDQIERNKNGKFKAVINHYKSSHPSL